MASDERPHSEEVQTIRIKRSRNDPSLPTFILGGSTSKRPALAQLSLDAPQDGTERNAVNAPKAAVRVRFRLVHTAKAGGFAARDERLQRGRRLQDRQHAAARFERVATRRLDDDTSTAVELELRRCSARDPATKPKLVPFGPPLPSAQPVARDQAFRWIGVGCPEDQSDELAGVWREAAAAACLESSQGTKSHLRKLQSCLPRQLGIPI